MIKLVVTYTPAQTLRATIQRVSDGRYWVPATQTWQVSVPFASKSMSVTEGTDEEVGSYTFEANGVSLQGDPGEVTVRVHDTGLANRTIHASQFHVVNNAKAAVDVSVSTRASPGDAETATKSVLETTLVLSYPTAVPNGDQFTVSDVMRMMMLSLCSKMESRSDTVTLYSVDGAPLFTQTIVTAEDSVIREAMRDAT